MGNVGLFSVMILLPATGATTGLLGHSGSITQVNAFFFLLDLSFIFKIIGITIL